MRYPLEYKTPEDVDKKFWQEIGVRVGRHEEQTEEQTNEQIKSIFLNLAIKELIEESELMGINHTELDDKEKISTELMSLTLDQKKLIFNIRDFQNRK